MHYCNLLGGPNKKDLPQKFTLVHRRLTQPYTNVLMGLTDDGNLFQTRDSGPAFAQLRISSASPGKHISGYFQA